MNAPNNNRKVAYDRAADDWYVEPSWAADLLFGSGMLPAGLPVWDPACGAGTIVQAAKRAGRLAVGSDIVDRGGRERDHDFFRHRPFPVGPVAIVSNPPFDVALEWALRALSLDLGPVALIVQLRFLAGLTRAHLYAEFPPAYEAVFSDRPSMPPGTKVDELGAAAFSGGTIDFACVVWNADRLGPTISRKLYRDANFARVLDKYEAAKRRVADWSGPSAGPADRDHLRLAATTDITNTEQGA